MRLFPLLFLCGFLPFLTSCHFGGPEALVPKDWILSPGNGGNGEEEAPFTPPETQDRLSRYVSHLYSLQAETIEEASAEAPGFSTAPSALPPDWVPWHLHFVITQLSISAQGILGPLLLGGSSTVQTIWEKRLPKPQLESRHRRRRKNRAFTTTLIQLEPAIQAAVEKGKIRNEEMLRKNLAQVTRDFRELGKHLNLLAARFSALGYSWSPVEFELEVAVSASGQVLPWGQAGGEAAFKFKWEKEEEHETRIQRRKKEEFPKPSDFATELEKFAQAVAPDLDAISPDLSGIEEHGLTVDGIKIGLGISVQGTIGIAQAQASAMGSLKFERPESEEHPAPAPRMTPWPAAPLLLIQRSAPSSQSIYDISHSTFQRGMRKALALGSFFAQAARKSRTDSPAPGAWILKELSTEFQMSLQGTIGLVTLQGDGTVEISFENEENE